MDPTVLQELIDILRDTDPRRILGDSAAPPPTLGRRKPRPVLVRLTGAERAESDTAGLGRRGKAVERARIEPHGTPTRANGTPIDKVQLDVWSSRSERAVAKALGQVWRSEIVDDLRQPPPDVGTNVEVRSSTNPAARYLMVYENNPVDHDYFFVKCHDDGVFWVMGWVPGEVAKAPERWRETWRPGHPAFLTHVDQLWDVRDYFDR